MECFGFININKPQGLTSHDVVAKLRKLLKVKQIGHTGTLDPLATGVLPIAIGNATRLIEFLPDGKTYIASLQFGKISDTYDIDGYVEDFSEQKVAKSDLTNVLCDFIGTIEQIPPAYSAVHYNGKRLYELARQGIIPDDIPKRTVIVDFINILDFDGDSQTARLEISCSSGTYIRSIIHDIGQTLGVGAVMTALTRTRSGEFFINNSFSLDDLSIDDVKNNLVNPLNALFFYQYELSDLDYNKVRHGMGVSLDLPIKNGEFVSLVKSNNLCAVANYDSAKKVAMVKKVFI